MSLYYHHRQHHAQQQQMRMSPLLARMAASAADACARQQADRLHCHWPDELLLLRGGWCLDFWCTSLPQERIKIRQF